MYLFVLVIRISLKHEEKKVKLELRPGEYVVFVLFVFIYLFFCDFRFLFVSLLPLKVISMDTAKSTEEALKPACVGCSSGPAANY